MRTPLRQWMLRITAYADRLAEDLKLVIGRRHTMNSRSGMFTPVDMRSTEQTNRTPGD